MVRKWWWVAGLSMTVVGLGWWVLRVTLLNTDDRSNASGYGQFVLAAAGILITLWQLVEPRVMSVKTATPEVDRLTDSLAVAMRNQWKNAATERGLLERVPLPIRWRRCTEPVAGPLAAATTTRTHGGSFDPLPGIDRVTPSQLREGTHRTLHRIYGGLASGRLIVVGAPGAGKSSAAVLLVLDALRYRDQTPPEQRPQIPVPVLFTLQNWDPVTTPVQDWIATKLTELPPLAGRHGRRHAIDLLRAGRIAVFLDGLDEIPEPLRPAALRALSQQATFRLILLTRTNELIAAAQHNILTSAAALELTPLLPTDAASYLLHALTDPPPQPWRALITSLTDSPDSPVARALTNPLTITLLRDIYPPTPTEGSVVGTVDELLDNTRFPDPDPDAITHHLLDHAITAAYTPQSGQSPPSRYTPDTAHRTLTLIAEYLRKDNTRDLARWTIPNWIPRTPRVFISALLGAIVLGFAFGLMGALVAKLAYALVGGLAFGFVFGFARGVTVSSRPVVLRRASWRQTLSIRELPAGFWAGLPASLGVGIAFGITVGFTAALTVGLVFGLTIGLAAALKAADPPDTIRPTELWRGDLVLGLTAGLTCGLGLGFGLAFGLGHEVKFGLALGFGITAGALGGLMTTEAWGAIVSQTYFRIHHHTPLRLGRFLEDARARHLLRTVGPIYQFRHATLQDLLAPPRPDPALAPNTR